MTPTAIAEGAFEECHDSSIYLKGIFESLCFLFSTLGWLGGQWEMGMYFSVLESHETPVLISTCLSCSLAPAHTEMSLGSAPLPGDICRAELSTQRVGWAL